MIARRKNREVKVNTTALPDIIFMLLFFFMVTTVLQDETVAQVPIPKVKSEAAPVIPDPSTVTIATQDGQTLLINGHAHLIDDLEKALISQNQNLLENGNYLETCLVYLPDTMSMHTVNKIKESLQKAEIYKVEYIHQHDL